MACIENDILTLYRDYIYIYIYIYKKEQQNQLYWSSHNKTSVLDQLSSQIHYMLPETALSDVLYASWNCLVRCTVCFLKLPCQMYCMLSETALSDVLYAFWNCHVRCTVCFLKLPCQMYCMLPGTALSDVLYASLATTYIQWGWSTLEAAIS